MKSIVDVDYLVVGAGAMGMAFVDALVAADERATVAIVDRRHGAGGHWLDAYGFVRLHQASAFYGVASTLLGEGRLQTDGPERGLHERATANEVRAYYDRVLSRLTATGRVEFHGRSEYRGERRFASLLSGTRFQAPRARLVDARYLAPDIPLLTPPPFAVEEGAHVVTVNELVRLDRAPRHYVVVGAGKTGTDTCVWLLQQGVDPNAITWVRPRDPWMLNRAFVQPDPAVFLTMAADTMAAAAAATSPDDVFLRLEDAGIMLRIDATVLPTMAKTPTLAAWELALVRTIVDVVRRGHVRSVAPGRLRFDDGDVRVPSDTLIVHCAAEGLKYPGLRPIWSPEAITPQPVRVGFPCFGAAIVGHVEATRDDDTEKNHVCRPSPFSNTPADWAAMQVIGGDASLAMTIEPDLRAWANETALNPVRIPADRAGDPAVVDARERLKQNIAPGRARLLELARQA
ncbi:pyridine nucleotide-disulfide oxidoreductase [Microbacterium sp. CFH 31415]|uniref:pyridine nucleotide-disulfide oxidoreductase n=1 Tax=Microbacterium sp. CFH 31415 TaxID=2921732 RepID=UPI001F1345EE|nr:pyridine nucleotide-disulfide oxidoreductase [Microbacterium sp. CFH 31415]MCH6232204.1 pyridine nucleotide-disulfide oxidoreductase [Microbacterium sp. CFH 31415]